MPQHICFKCAERLKQPYSFKLCILESEDQLQPDLEDIQTKDADAAIEVVTDSDIEVAKTEITGFVEEKVHLEKIEINEDVTEQDPDYILYDEECEEGYAEEADLISVSPNHIDGLNNICDICGKGYRQQCRLHQQGIKKENSKINATLIEVDVEYVNVADGAIEKSRKEISRFVEEEEDNEFIEYDEEIEENSVEVEIDEVDTGIEPNYILYDEECEEGYAEKADGVGDAFIITVCPKYVDGLNNICDICGKGFRDQCRLRQHMQAHTYEKHYICEVCGKKLKHQKNYEDHAIMHTDIRPHQCNICSRFYRTTTSLAVHKRIHAEDKPFKCEMCGRGFVDLQHIQRHMLTHMGERPYACNLCDKAYYDASSMRVHMNKHNGIKAFKCEICGVGLTQKSGYKKHMMVHSGEKPHKCPICGRCFTISSNMNAHIRLHSGERPFKCDKCPKCFPTKSGLRSHQRVHNKDITVCSTDVLSAIDRKNVLMREGQKIMPDMPDKQVSRSKVVVVL